MDSLVPSSKLGRGKVVGKALLKIGVTKTKGFVKKPFSSNEKNQQYTNEAIANIIFEALGELKGVSVKIAQQVALSMPFLSDVYLEKISKTFNQIPTMNKVLVRKTIKQELNDTPQKIFDTFEMEAFGAASLGQVHKATYKGDELAVKIQYPGIKKSIETDISIINFALKRFAKGEDVTHLIGEIEDRLYEEVDYIQEASNYEFFKDNIINEDIVVPQVYKQLSTDKVLITSYLDGLDFGSFLDSNPTQESKNRYAQMILDNFFYSLYKLKKIHADPNPGNFLFLDDGKLGLIDFGCVKTIEDGFIESYSQLNSDDEEQAINMYVELGMIVKDTPQNMKKFYEEVIKPLDTLYKEPLLEDSYDFALNNDFSKRGFELVFEVQQKQFNSVDKFNEQFLFVNRTLLGHYALFEKMEQLLTLDMSKAL